MTSPPPTARAPRFRCAAASLARDEAMAGTASTVRAFLLVEDAGPWGENAVTDSRLPGSVRRWLGGLEARHQVRPLLVRRPGARRGGPVRVFAARAGGPRRWVGTTTLDDVTDLPALDVAGLHNGPVEGLTPYPDPLFLVCSHGRHDACCAELGRPVAAALAAVAPAHTWEVSHIGGDRFAANILVLPHGLYYGRVEVTDVQGFVDAHLEGRLDLEHLRGRSTYNFPVQAAEIHLRRHLRLDAADPLRVVERQHEDHRTTVVFAAAGVEWQVDVVTEPATEQLLTCRSLRGSAARVQRVVGLRRR